jgi:hypothetical protein
MNPKHSQTTATPETHDADLSRLHKAGRQAAKTMTVIEMHKPALSALEVRAREAKHTISDATLKPASHGVHSRCLYENFRLIRTAQKETRDIVRSLRHHRAVRTEFGAELPRAYAVAQSYLSAALDFFSEEGLGAFLRGFQEEQELEMGEVWAIKPALQIVLLERIASASTSAGPTLPLLVTNLRTIGECEWKDLFEAVSIVDGVLASDPAECYTRMDYASRDQYRVVIAEIAKHSNKSERFVAETAVRLAAEAQQGPGGLLQSRQAHVGYWIIDDGLLELREAVGYQRPLMQRIRDLVFRYREGYYLVGIEMLTFLLVVALVEPLDTLTPILGALLLLLVPASQAAVDFINNLTTFLVPPRVLPKLDFSEGIPREYATMVAVPALLLNERQVRELVMDLEIRHLGNRDPNLCFALVTDFPDSDRREDERDVLADVCAELIRELNGRYGSAGRTPFYLFHRHRKYNPSEGRWMGWERKRGKLLDLNQLMRGGPDSFPVKIGDLSVLPKIKYVITLDSDTQLPRDAAQRLIGAMAHPLNRPVLDPVTKMVLAGYGIIQPRIGISIQSASRSRLASIYSGQTGFDIYTRAVSDVYQDLFGEGIFTGKGIYDVDALRDSLEHRFPENALLSHDLIEGAYARAALASDIELIDDYPSHFSAYSRRKHRWVRGDWQIMRWLWPSVPDFHNRTIPNPINLVSRWKILDNLRRSMFEPALLTLLLGGWLWLKGDPLYWTITALAILLIPVWASLFFSLLRAPLGSKALFAWTKDTLIAFAKGHAVALLQLVFLLHQAMLSLDAIIRSMLRVLVTRRRLLEWETAAESENAQARKSTVDVYLGWSPLVAAAIAAAVWLVRPAAMPAAAPVLFLWFIALGFSEWLNRVPRAGRKGLTRSDVQFVRAGAVRTWRFFREWSTAENNWLIPDNVRADGTPAPRLSPTNLGFLLNARVAAVHFGYLTLPEFVEQTEHTLRQYALLPKHRGHMLNWYSNETLMPLEPLFVSTVDSGNLVACLWTLKQAALSFAAKPPSDSALWAGISATAEQAPEPLRDRIERSELNWKTLLPELEQLARGSAASSSGDEAFWAAELADRLSHARSWLETGLTDELRASLLSIAEQCDRFATEMDFVFLYQRRKKVLSVGWDVATDTLEPSSYDLLASESRIAAFVAIAKGDVPQDAWFHLGRRHTLFGGERVLVSWTGTMFEYLMPALWMRGYRNTILQDSMEAAVRVQRKTARRKRLPWGISESGSAAAQPGAEYGYAAYGIPEIAMKPGEHEATVISPYSSFLALPVEPRAAIRNLRDMEKLGWFGRYGFYEAVDYTRGGAEVIESWMAHHQGMSLLAACNLLFDSPMQSYFHNEPQVLATELLLQERVPSMMVVEAETSPAAPELAAEAAA